MTVAWVIGGGGLLGTALCRALRQTGTTLFVPSYRFHWGHLEFESQIARAIQTFSYQVSVANRWEIYWAAGVGTMSSPKEKLKFETDSLALLLRLLSADRHLLNKNGGIAFTSSAGAVYAGSDEAIITEKSNVAPTTDYAREKLEQEGLINQFAKRHDVNALIARVSTVYGPGQANGKKQGLLSQIARGILRNQPIQIYVPFDTIRDYIAADDAAGVMVEVLHHINKKTKNVIKIIASEKPVTISEIIFLFKRISRRKPQVIVSQNMLSGLYSRRIQFKSIVETEFSRSSIVSLPVGISQLMMEERVSFARGGAL